MIFSSRSQGNTQKVDENVFDLITKHIHVSAFMTIDSGWVKILKRAAPHAFTASQPVTPGVVFIDGQIKLMKGEHVRTWKQFVECQFYNTIDRCFQTGAHTVVLGFDNYKHVPTAKNMTQRKRSQHVPPTEFDESMSLPTVLPEYWDSAMRNRAFKAKVMAMVCNNVRLKYSDCTRTVVLDFRDEVEVLGAARALPPLLCSSPRPKRGECDIKAFAYATPNDPLLIVSTDGDFVPISLVQIERALQNSESAPRIILHRIATNVSKPGEKRKKGREMEFVDVNALYAFLKTELVGPSPALAFSTLVACTGCDFTMNLPQLGPTRLWTHRHLLTAQLRDGLSTENVGKMIAHAYTQTFMCRARVKCLAVSCPRDSLQTVLCNIKKSTSIAARTRDSIWSYDRTEAHARNTVWTLHYWTLLHEHPDPVSGDFGFCVRDGQMHFKV